MSGIIGKKRASADVTTPPSGYVTQFVDTDGTPKLKDENGNVLNYAASSATVGDVTTLVTTAKDTVVAAVNEVAGKALTTAETTAVRSGTIKATYNGLNVTVYPFSVGGFVSTGGTITVVPSGTWYVGIDLFSKEVIALPRLGHRGWIPLAKVIASASAITSFTLIEPQIPTCRLPRTVKKILNNETLNVVVMGSSLAEGTDVTLWSGMLFNSNSSVSNYLVAPSNTFQNIALGGTPNGYQMAQLGRATFNSGIQGLSTSGFDKIFDHQTPPSGRSQLFNGVDLVVLTTLANGGDYRTELFEPIIRQLRKRGIEVIVTTDNAQAAAASASSGSPFADQASYTTGGLYPDGPRLMRIADVYNVEIADTAAYVCDACLRYPTFAIYRDAIHMASGSPTGRTGKPSGGYEVWARAIRSVIPIDYLGGTAVSGKWTYDFTSGVSGWSGYGIGTVATSGANLVCTKSASTTAQWGAVIPVNMPITVGDTYVVSGNITYSTWNGGTNLVTVGLNGSGWVSSTNTAIGSASVTTSQAFSVTLTANKALAQNGTVLFFANWDAATVGTAFSISNLSIAYTTSTSATSYETFTRTYSAQILPASRVVTDLKTPGDATVTLPAAYASHTPGAASAGVSLAAHPYAAASFARRFSSLTSSTSDMLLVPTGEKFQIAGDGIVGAYIIYYVVSGDTAVTIDVYRNSAFVKTIALGMSTTGREIMQSIYTPSELTNNSATPGQTTIELRVTAGTLRLAASVCYTFDMDYVMPELITKIGSGWTGRVNGGGAGMMGYATDSITDYAFVKCPDNAQRVAWIVSGRPNGKAFQVWSADANSTAQTAVGVSHVVASTVFGPGSNSHIQLTTANTATDQSTNGYGLHIGGVIVVYDR